MYASFVRRVLFAGGLVTCLLLTLPAAVGRGIPPGAPIDGARIGLLAPFSLRLPAPSREDNDNIPGVPIPPSPFDGTGNASTDPIDVYAVTLAEGQSYAFSATNPVGTADFDLALYPPTATDVQAGGYVAWAFGPDYPARCSYTVPAGEGGVYYLMVYTYTGSGTYRVKYGEANDNIPGVPVPPSPFTGEGSWPSGDTFDVYAVDLVAGQTYAFGVTNPAGSASFVLKLYDRTATDLDQVLEVIRTTGTGTPYPRRFTYVVPEGQGGTYYLVVEAWTGSGTYRVTYGDEDDNIPGVPIPTSPFVGMADVAEDTHDVYAVDLTAGQTYAFDVTNPDEGLDSDVRLFAPGVVDIYDGTGIVASSTGGVTAEHMGYTVPEGAGGTYFVDVIADSGSGAYQVSYGTVMNTPPVLDPIGQQWANEVFEFSFTATASDADGDALSFSLGAGAPAGAAITAGGLFTWTPTEAQGPGNHLVTVIVSDTWGATDSETITITVVEVNVEPVLAAIGNRSVNELATLSFTATATDSDIPANTLAFSLGAGAPAGAAITAGGLFTWTPTEAQGPGSYPVTVVVTDNVGDKDSETITITVNEVNSPPVLAAIGNRSVNELATLSFTATATDSDIPANTLAFSLGAGAPAGAAITAGGLFTWTPSAGQVGNHNITIVVSDGKGGIDSETITVAVTAVPASVTFIPIAGPNRYATSVEVSKRAFPTGADAVVIATGENWPDALGGASLAGALDGPILLTKKAALPSEVLAEITRLFSDVGGPVERAYILGSTAAVSSSVESALTSRLGQGNVTRLGGANRYETARLIAAETVEVLKAGGTYDGTAFVATGANFPDALGASPLAAANGWPIFLVNPSTGADAALVNAMKAAGVTKALVLGSTSAVSDGAENNIASKVPCQTQRLFGANRYDTAVAVANHGVLHAGLHWDQLAIATGQNFPDALAGGVLQGRSASVLLLTPSTVLSPSVANTLTINKATIHEVRFLGGPTSVSSAVRTAVANALK